MIKQEAPTTKAIITKDIILMEALIRELIILVFKDKVGKDLMLMLLINSEVSFLVSVQHKEDLVDLKIFLQIFSISRREVMTLERRT